MLNAESPRLVLPPVPDDQRDAAVAIWSQPLVIETYEPEEPDRFPAYLDARVYQGSSGRVFPLPFIERIASTRSARTWHAVHLENEWVRIVVLPELGGRIHIGYDKVAGYDFFYRNNVIKPALVGLTGPWISGGVEFNWPQHHRPATYLPTDVEIEVDDDGSATVWCADHDPFARMKGMHGIRLRPDSSRVEAHVRLQNRSETTQTFLWWANVAARVGDDYQSFFPGDVGYVADHARRAISAFPQADRHYYGIDYPARRDAEHPDGDRLDWYRNIPVPTSYMITATGEEFFGGYDHGHDAGFVHWAPREVSPGKKQWTWGNAPFGWAWDANLTDGDGPYVELMAGVFTDNQPDFAWLAPGETKTFRQVWYPVRGTGLVTAAGEDAAARVASDDTGADIVIAASVVLPGARLVVRGADGATVLDRLLDLDPGATVAVRVEVPQVDVELRHGDRVVLVASSRPHDAAPEPVTAEAPPEPADVASVDELHAIATYLQQYRHATRSPEPYWAEVLRRDPDESRARTALGAIAYGRADYTLAAEHLRAAVHRVRRWAPTPRDAEPLYLLGLVEIRRGDLGAAAELLARASWDEAWRDASLFALARLRAAQGDRNGAIRALTELLPLRPDHLQSRDLLAALLIAAGDRPAASAILADVLARDPLDQWARHLAGRPLSSDPTVLLDVALEYADAGLLAESLGVLDEADRARAASGQVDVERVVAAHRAEILDRLGRRDQAAGERRRARSLPVRHAQALRLSDIRALETSLAADPTDSGTALLLGNWYYDRRRGADAVAAWTVAADADDVETAVVARRNLGLAAYNLERDAGGARQWYESARARDPRDAKLLYEFDQLRARLGDDPAARLRELRAERALVDTRDDLTVVFVELLVETGGIDEALDVLSARRFQPWEGGEGRVLAAWDSANLAAARRALAAADGVGAEAAVRRSLVLPASLGEARHDLANAAEIWLVLGDARAAQGDQAGARAAWGHAAANAARDFVKMSVTPYSARTWWSIVALRRLGRGDEADALERGLRDWVADYATREPVVDYFATSLPTMLLFAPDLTAERDAEVAVNRRQLGELDRVAAG